MANSIVGKWSHKKIPLGKMHISSRHAQREKINQSRVDYLVSNFDLDKIGIPELSERGSGYYIMDGQHRIEALKFWLGDGWESQKIECRVWENLTEEQEAERFLSLNDTLQVNAFDKFRVAVQAGRADEVHINNIVKGAELVISRDKIPGSLRAVGTLKKVYKRSDGNTLARTLRIIRDSFGESGFDAMVIDGIGHLCQRYNGVLDEPFAVDKLGSIRGGVNGLLGKAETLHKSTGQPKSHCVAAAAVDFINSGRGRNRIASWWKNAD